MHNAYLSPNFQSNGINSLLEDDRMFMSNFIIFRRGTLHSSSQRSKHLPYISFRLWGFPLWRHILLSESALVEGQRSSTIHNSKYLVCAAHN